MNDDESNPAEVDAKKEARHNSGAADLEKVTDYAEEKEITTDGGNLNDAMNAISDRRRKEAEKKAEHEKQLASVKVKREEVDLIVSEFEISKSKAERVLKEHNGNIAAALSALINA